MDNLSLEFLKESDKGVDGGGLSYCKYDEKYDEVRYFGGRRGDEKARVSREIHLNLKIAFLQERKKNRKYDFFPYSPRKICRGRLMRNEVEECSSREKRIYFADELLLKCIRPRDCCLNDLIYNTY